MEDIIRRRHPNSIPALIYAASAVPGQNKVYESVEGSNDNATTTNRNNKNITAFLEKQVKTLEKELEDRDEENSRKVRAIEQQYNAMSLRYEDHIKQLEDKLVEVSTKSKSSMEFNKNEDELAKQKEEYEKIISKLRDRLMDIDIAKQNEDLDKDRTEAVDKSKKTSRKNDALNSNNNVSKKELNKLKTKLLSKDAEVDELRSTVLLLQREREQLLLTVSRQTVVGSAVNITSRHQQQLQQKRSKESLKLLDNDNDNDNESDDSDDNLGKKSTSTIKRSLEESSRKLQLLEIENKRLHQKIEVCENKKIKKKFLNS